MKLSAVAAATPVSASATAPDRCNATERVRPESNENSSTPLSRPAQFSFVDDPDTRFANAVTPATCAVNPGRPSRPPDSPSTSTPVCDAPPWEIRASFKPDTDPETPTEPAVTSYPEAAAPSGVNPPPTPTNTLEPPRLNAHTSASVNVIGLEDALSDPLAVVWSTVKLFAVATTAPPTDTATAPDRWSVTKRVSPLSNENGSTPLSNPAQFSFVVEPDTVFASADAPATCTVNPVSPRRLPESPSTCTPV